MDKIRVLFLCTGNSARSQMAEAILRRIAGDLFEPYSAGIEAKGIHPLTRQVMAEKGYGLQGQYSKNFDEYMGKMHFGYLITVCANAEEQCPAVFPGIGQRLHWPFEDPAAFEGTEAEKLDKFRLIRDQIEQHLRNWIAELGKATA